MKISKEIKAQDFIKSKHDNILKRLKRDATLVIKLAEDSFCLGKVIDDKDLEITALKAVIKKALPKLTGKLKDEASKALEISE